MSDQFPNSYLPLQPEYWLILSMNNISHFGNNGNISDWVEEMLCHRSFLTNHSKQHQYRERNISLDLSVYARLNVTFSILWFTNNDCSWIINIVTGEEADVLCQTAVIYFFYICVWTYIHNSDCMMSWKMHPF